MLTVPRRRRHLPTALRRAAAETAPDPSRCNALSGQGRPCRRRAGWGTVHRGTGRCAVHDQTPTFQSIQRWQHIQSPALRRRLDTMAAIEEDILDLVPDVQLIRALIVDYVERYDELHAALLAWYRDGKMKPAHPLSLHEAVQYLEAISRIVERIYKIRHTGSVSMDTFRRILEQMGIIVARHVTDGTALDLIEHEWSQLAIDARATTPVAALPPGTTAMTVPSTPKPRRRRSPHPDVDPAPA